MEADITGGLGELDVSGRVRILIRRIIVRPDRCPIRTVGTLLDIEHVGISDTFSFVAISADTQDRLCKGRQAGEIQRRVADIGLSSIDISEVKRKFIGDTGEGQSLVFMRPVGCTTATDGKGLTR